MHQLFFENIPLKYSVNPLFGDGVWQAGSYKRSTPKMLAFPYDVLKSALHIPCPKLRLLLQSQLSSSSIRETTPFCLRYMKESCLSVGPLPVYAMYVTIKERFHMIHPHFSLAYTSIHNALLHVFR